MLKVLAVLLGLALSYAAAHAPKAHPAFGPGPVPVPTCPARTCPSN